jgi:hypothetical protein
MPCYDLIDYLDCILYCLWGGHCEAKPLPLKCPVHEGLL